MTTGESTVQWRPERNTLTTPETYIARYIPRGVVGYAHLASGYVQKHPTCDQELAEDVMEGMTEEILEQLINGYQVTLKNGFTFRLSFTGRLKHPDDSPGPVEEILQARIYASHPFVERLRQSVTLERLPASEKLPLITSAVDTVRKLDDFLNPIGALRLTGEEAVRIQVILNLHEGFLLFNLLDMHEDGVEGEAVRMTANGPLTLAGFAGSGLTSLDLTVNDFDALRDMIRNDYSGRLVDVLHVESGD
jgi:hypothetical protein